MSTADRELLELAAKAAGVDVHPHLGPGAWVGGMSGNKYFSQWNPLADDGDALRLAVRLRLLVTVETGEVWAMPHMDDDGPSEPIFNDSDPYAATRRAIVRAAAEIGRAMP